MAEIEVHLGKIEVSARHDILRASGVGSCVVITMYDPGRKIGGMAHAMLPENIPLQIEEMLYKMHTFACSRKDLEAKLVGGANMFPGLESDIGMKNVLAARDKIKKENIQLVGESIGGSIGRSIEFSAASGIVTVKIKF